VFSYPVDEARELLERAGFSVSEVGRPSSTYPPGRVIGQSPEAGDKAPEGSTVTIYVSTADNRSSVPDVLGYTSEQARATLRNAGFDVEVVFQSEPGRKGNSRNDRVWKQSPSGGTAAQQGSNVTIWVNP
jgi:serine/threonine-protein kinase